MHEMTHAALHGTAAGPDLVAVLFLTGLAGGAAHCGLMCGPLVLAQVMARIRDIPAGPGGEARRLAGTVLLPYHLGRLVTYALLGAAGGGVVGRLGDLSPWWRWLAVGLLALAALVLAVQALPRRWRPAAAWGAGLAGRMARVAGPLLDAPVGWRGLVLGLILGLLPCGMLYAAVAAAAAAADPMWSAAAMLGFGLGTVPSLVVIALVGQTALARVRAGLGWLGPLAMMASAGWLAMMALRLAQAGPR